MPETELPLPNDDYAELRRTVNPLQESEYHGKEEFFFLLYCIAIGFPKRRLRFIIMHIIFPRLGWQKIDAG